MPCLYSLYKWYYFIGSFAGVPAFRGNTFGVAFSFFIDNNTLLKSDSGTIYSTVSFIIPPILSTALVDSFISFPQSPALYEINWPPTLTNGIQNSDNVARLATALDTHMSYFSRYSGFFPKSSLLPCINSIFSIFSSSLTSFKKLSPDFDYSVVSGLRKEATQKLNQYKPLSIGQASRISGVSPADISVLLVYMKQHK